MVHWRDFWTGRAACFESATRTTTIPEEVSCAKCLRYLGLHTRAKVEDAAAAAGANSPAHVTEVLGGSKGPS